MELLKLNESPAEFAWNGITILYRTKMTVGDRFEINAAGIPDRDAVKIRKLDLAKVLIRLFVVGWRGVTEDGKEVPYSYDTLMTRLPSDLATDLVMNLGAKITEDTGLYKPPAVSAAQDDLKNA